MPFRLRYLQHNLELSLGDFYIGRSAECQLALDDPLVSRRHAVLVVKTDSVLIKDLRSRNGVVVNGTKIDISRVLLNGDRVMIGSQELTLVAAAAPRLGADNPVTRTRAGTQTLSSTVPIISTLPEPSTDSTSRRMESFPVLAALADKALALGRSEDAERILTSLMNDVLKAAERNEALPAAEVVDQAARYSVRLATATGKGSWVDYVIKLYTAVRRPCPAPLVEELHSVLRKTSGIDLAGLRTYLEILRESTETFGPAQRFLVQRIEGLERLASAK